jgi:hypothetical protein
MRELKSGKKGTTTTAANESAEAKRANNKGFQTTHTKEAHVLKPRMTQTMQAAIPITERFCQATSATYLCKM